MAFGSRVIRRAFAAVALAGIATLSACGGDDSTGPKGNTYTLRSINNDPLPATIEHGPGFTETTNSGSLTFGNNNTFSAVSRGSATVEGQTFNFTITTSGTYQLNGNAYTLHATRYVVNGQSETADDFYSGTLSGTTITIDVDGDVYLYSK